MKYNDFINFLSKIGKLQSCLLYTSFLNRFDDISVFRMLERDDLERIVHLEADKLISRRCV